MGLTPQQEFMYSRYEYFLVYKNDVKVGYCSNNEIEQFERFFPNHNLIFEKISDNEWLDEFKLAELNGPDSKMPEYCPDEVEKICDYGEIRKLLNK